MTGKQRRLFLRFLLDAVEDIREERDEKKRAEKLDRVIHNLRTATGGSHGKTL